MALTLWKWWHDYPDEPSPNLSLENEVEFPHVSSSGSARYVFGPPFGGGRRGAAMGEAVSDWSMTVSDCTRCCMAGVAAASAVPALARQSSSNYTDTCDQQHLWMLYLCESSLAGCGVTRGHALHAPSGAVESDSVLTMRLDHGTGEMRWLSSVTSDGALEEKQLAEGVFGGDRDEEMVPVVLLYSRDSVQLRAAALIAPASAPVAVPVAEGLDCPADDEGGGASAPPAVPPVQRTVATVNAAATVMVGATIVSTGSSSNSSSSEDDDGVI